MLLKTPWHPTINHNVLVSINEVDNVVHIVEETCYSLKRCRCNRGYLEGSSDEISSDESGEEMSLLSGKTLHVGVSDDTQVVGVERGEQTRHREKNLWSGGQCNEKEPMDNNQEPLICGPTNLRSSDSVPRLGDATIHFFDGVQIPTRVPAGKYGKQQQRGKISGEKDNKVDAIEGSVVIGGEKTESRDDNGKHWEERGPLMNQNFELKEVQVHDVSEEREKACSITGNNLKNTVQRQSHTEK